MEETEIQSLIKRYIQSYNSFDVNGMVDLLHEDIEFRNISHGEVDTETKGMEQFRKLAEQSVTIFSQREQTITRMTVIGDKAEVEINYEGKLAKDLANGFKAGDSIELKGKTIFHVRDQKIAVIEDYS